MTALDHPPADCVRPPATAPIRVGVGLGLHTMWDSAAEFAQLVRRVELAGFDSLWFSEHLTGPTPAPLPQIAFAAALTSRIKLGTSVTVLGGRNPVDLAKTLATVDRLCQGRLLPVFGLGTAEPAEHAAFAIGRYERGGWVDEALPVVRRLLSGERVRHSCRFFTLDDIGIGMSSVRPRMDVWLGGRAAPELRRAGRLADGWLGSFLTPELAGRAVRVVAAAAADAGRAIDPEHFGMLLMYASAGRPAEAQALLDRFHPGTDPHWLCPVGPGALTEVLAAHASQGISKFIIVPAGRPDRWPAELDALAENLAGSIGSIRARVLAGAGARP